MLDLEPHISIFTLAQNGGAAPSLPGEPRTVETQTSNNTGDGSDAPPVGPFGSNLVLVMFAVIAMMIVFSIFGQRRERKRRDEMIRSMKKHDKVQTIGGVIGSVVELKPDFVVLKVDESSNTRITFARSAIQQVIKSTDSKSDETEKVESV